MVRNLYTLKVLPYCPTRVWVNKAGPGESNLIKSAISSNGSSKIISKNRENKKSKLYLMQRKARSLRSFFIALQLDLSSLDSFISGTPCFSTKGVILALLPKQRSRRLPAIRWINGRVCLSGKTHGFYDFQYHKTRYAYCAHSCVLYCLFLYKSSAINNSPPDNPTFSFVAVLFLQVNIALKMTHSYQIFHITFLFSAFCYHKNYQVSNSHIRPLAGKDMFAIPNERIAQSNERRFGSCLARTATN